MKARILFLLCVTMASMSAIAQETFEDANLMSTDLNGTARYVGMGGAMDALGADLSTISTNPAGIALFRGTSAAATVSLVRQTDGNSARVSFDQIGAVYSNRIGSDTYVNFAVNYHKDRNFNQVLKAADALNGAALNRLTFAKDINGLLQDDEGYAYITGTQLDELVAEAVLWDQAAHDYVPKYGSSYIFNRQSKGYAGVYDFNLSANLHDRWYLGLTVGVHDLNYKATTEYDEVLLGTTSAAQHMRLTDYRHIDGTGFDMKFGVIWRPIEESPFRVGLSVATPTFYDLTSESSSSIGNKNVRSIYDFELNSPWKFGLSAGHTIGGKIALGAVYEYADYSHINNRALIAYDADYVYDWYYDSSIADKGMNEHTKESLNGVSTLKLGAEYRISPSWSVRCGYNYQSPIFKKNAAKGIYNDGEIVVSPGIYTSSSADYTNWESTNRFTLGLGYSYKQWTADLAYQYSQVNGKFHPFLSYEDNYEPAYDNVVDAVSVSNKRNQLLFTLGYKF